MFRELGAVAVSGLCTKPAVEQRESPGNHHGIPGIPHTSQNYVVLLFFFDESKNDSIYTTPSIRLHLYDSHFAMPNAKSDSAMNFFHVKHDLKPPTSHETKTAIAPGSTAHIFGHRRSGQICKSIGPRATRIVPAATGDLGGWPALGSVTGHELWTSIGHP